MSNLKFIYPQWSPSSNVKALVTTRVGGGSKGPYSGLNLATHVGDDLRDVILNRNLLSKNLPASPIWLNQVHGVTVFDASKNNFFNDPVTADAVVTTQSNQVLSIMTADCLPILFAHKEGLVVGAAHAGWRGLCGGIIENTISELMNQLSAKGVDAKISDLSVWLGPCIGQKHFEVGQDVFDAFMFADANKGDISSCFSPLATSGKYLADLHSLAKIRLKHLGIQDISETQSCCFEEKENYFSYRRDKVTGRFATLIWIEPK